MKGDICTCLHCGCTWTQPKNEPPARCRGCSSATWDQPPKRSGSRSITFMSRKPHAAIVRRITVRTQKNH